MKLEEPLKFESRKQRRVLAKRKDSFLKESRGADRYEDSARKIKGILAKNVGKYWPDIWNELKDKVKPIDGESLTSRVEYFVERNTWMQQGKIYYPDGHPYGWQNYFVHPETLLLEKWDHKRKKPAFRAPTTLTLNNTKYAEQNGVWFKVTFSKEQQEMIAKAKSCKPYKSYISDKLQKHPGKLISKTFGVSVELETKVKNDGYPAYWHDKRLKRVWYELFQRMLAIRASRDELEGELYNHLGIISPNIIYNTNKYETVPNLVKNCWCYNYTDSSILPSILPSNDNWTPYRFDLGGGLELNPNPRVIKETKIIFPEVKPIGGKELMLVKEHILKLKRKYENN